LAELLKRHVTRDPRVVVGPGIGIDAAVIDMGDRLLVAKSDPITFTGDEIGWYAVHVNANDVACCGAAPRWFLATILLPETAATPELARQIFQQISEACRSLGAVLCGGHTEISHGLSQPIVVGHMLGEVAKEDYVTAAGARVGDALVLTKGFALEGTAILAREKREELRGAFAEEELQRCAQFIHEPGISVVRDARLALEVGGVHALHDPTEGGLATGLRETAEASGVGLRVEEDRLPLVPECERLCRHFGLDPLGVIASGALLMAVERERCAAIVEHLRRHGIAAFEMGQVVPAEEGLTLRRADGSRRELPTFARDEITRLF
jgi:hydrogenase maturation factor